MTDDKVKKYVELIACMSIDYLGGGITIETYIQNLKLLIEALELNHERKQR